jgi:hypothetical protein
MYPNDSNLLAMEGRALKRSLKFAVCALSLAFAATAHADDIAA